MNSTSGRYFRPLMIPVGDEPAPPKKRFQRTSPTGLRAISAAPFFLYTLNFKKLKKFVRSPPSEARILGILSGVFFV
jgi:hypothetical protein